MIDEWSVINGRCSIGAWLYVTELDHHVLNNHLVVARAGVLRHFSHLSRVCTALMHSFHCTANIAPLAAVLNTSA